MKVSVPQTKKYDKLDNLMSLTEGVNRIKLYKQTSLKSAEASFKNGRDYRFLLTDQEIGKLVKRLEVAGWKVTPMVACWGFTARREVA